jgi:hypothetical protein
MRHPRVRIALCGASAALLFGGCQHETAPSTTTATTVAKPAPRAQLLFAVPEMGRISGSCKSDSVFRLTFTAAPDVGEDFVVSVRGAVVGRRGLNPGASFSLPVKVATQRPAATTPPIEVKATVIREPYDAHLLARFKLASALGTGTCVATSARLRARTHFHFG